ncbi:MAG: thioredoxin family protein [Flavobacteriales bacterium]|jgi:hypothetical protein
MKKIMLLASAALAISVAAVLPDNPETLAIGSPAPKADLEMKGTSGELYSLRKVSGANGLVVIFTCNTCPFVVGADGYGEGWEGRYGGINGACAKSNVGVIYVNSNEAKREKGDNLEDMKERAAANRYGDVPYVLDKNSELANAFGARTTPHVFVFDKNLKLVYRGAIDDNYESPAKVKQSYLLDAISNLAAGKKVDPADTKPVGCSIKRVS